MGPGPLLCLGKNIFGDSPPPPLISGSISPTMTGNQTLTIAMTGRNALSIELIKPTGEQDIVSYFVEEILKQEWHIDKAKSKKKYLEVLLNLSL